MMSLMHHWRCFNSDRLCDVNMGQLRSFVTLAAVGHFTRAAAELHLAQPSLSRQIATLEKDLGAELFHRARGHITLTTAGESVLPLAQRMVSDAALMRREVAELAGLRRGRVDLGATPTLSVSIVAETLERFHCAYPGIDLHVTERGSRELIAELRRGALDLALIVAADPSQDPSLTLRPLLAEELVVVSSADQPPLTRRSSLTLAQVARQPQVIFHRGYDLRATTDAAFRAADLTPMVAVEGMEMGGALALVERGLGVAVVPAMVLIGRPRLRSVRLVEPRLHRTVSLAHRSDVSLTHAARALQAQLLDTVDHRAARGPGDAALITRVGR